jgi:phage baseplate assembly protein gpV
LALLLHNTLLFTYHRNVELYVNDFASTLEVAAKNVKYKKHKISLQADMVQSHKHENGITVKNKEPFLNRYEALCFV